MAKTVLSFKTDAEKRDALDSIAASMDRDRTYVINQALDAYLDIYQWQVGRINEAQRQAKEGDFLEESEWRKAFNRNRT